jgi:chromosome partitioning protein
MKTVAFFNNKGGVGKTSLVYHLAWMLAEREVRVLAVDLDPQANLTSMFLAEERLEELWPDDEHPSTVYGAIRPILRGIGDIAPPHVEMLTPRLGLIPGDLGLSRFEDKLSSAWPTCHNRDESAFRTMTAFYRMIRQGAAQSGAAIALIDVGPNLGAINRAALIASDQVVVPLGADMFSLQGLKNLGPALHEWRETWHELSNKAPNQLEIPSGQMAPVGYVVSQHGVRESRPVKSYQRWLDRIPSVYRHAVLRDTSLNAPKPAQDPYALALLKHYRSLMPMAMEAHKPMFSLRSADGAIGSHIEAVQACYQDFLSLAHKVGHHAGIVVN